MFIDLQGSTALYEKVGDFQAYRLVREFFAVLAKAIRASNGTIVKTISAYDKDSKGMLMKGRHKSYKIAAENEEDMERWMKSWGTDAELPPPEPRPRIQARPRIQE